MNTAIVPEMIKETVHDTHLKVETRLENYLNISMILFEFLLELVVSVI